MLLEVGVEPLFGKDVTSKLGECVLVGRKLTDIVSKPGEGTEVAIGASKPGEGTEVAIGASKPGERTEVAIGASKPGERTEVAIGASKLGEVGPGILAV